MMGPWSVLSLGAMLAVPPLAGGLVPPCVVAETRQKSVGIRLLLIHLLGGKGKGVGGTSLGGGQFHPGRSRVTTI